jgi:hypothetical protein
LLGVVLLTNLAFLETKQLDTTSNNNHLPLSENPAVKHHCHKYLPYPNRNNNKKQGQENKSGINQEADRQPDTKNKNDKHQD